MSTNVCNILMQLHLLKLQCQCTIVAILCEKDAVFFPAAIDDQLFFNWKGKPRPVVMDQKHLRDILHECHDNAGHFGTRRTLDKVLASCHWGTLCKDVLD